jgi:hypothetical protein
MFPMLLLARDREVDKGKGNGVPKTTKSEIMALKSCTYPCAHAHSADFDDTQARSARPTRAREQVSEHPGSASTRLQHISQEM